MSLSGDGNNNTKHTASSVVRIWKGVCGDEIRRFEFRVDASFDDVVAKLSEMFPPVVDGNNVMRLHWIDEDSDKVAIKSDEDLRLFIQGQEPTAAIRVFVSYSSATDGVPSSEGMALSDPAEAKCAWQLAKQEAKLAKLQAKQARFWPKASPKATPKVTPKNSPHPKAMNPFPKRMWVGPKHAMMRLAPANGNAGPKHAPSLTGPMMRAWPKWSALPTSVTGVYSEQPQHAGEYWKSVWMAKQHESTPSSGANIIVDVTTDANNAHGADVSPLIPLVQANPRHRARFVKDVTCPAGTEYAPGTQFIKTWRFRNDTVNAWPEGCYLMFVSKKHGDRMGAPETVMLPMGAGAGDGSETDISLELTAPTDPGVYTGFWRLCEPDGRKFGQRVRVQVRVASSSSSSDGALSSDSDANSGTDGETSFAWAKSLRELEAMGFSDRRRNVRLLIRFSGNMDRVVMRLLAIAERQAAVKA